MFKKGKNYFTLAIMILWCFNSFSQEESIYENYYLNPFIINPGATGAEYYTVAGLSYKKQWLGIPDSPTTLLLSGNSLLGKYDFYDPKGFLNKGPLKIADRIGVGAAIYRDNNGPLANTGIILSYAYQVIINADSKLAFGLSGIGTNYSLNSSELKPDQINDPYLLTGNDNIFRANINLGAYYFTGDYYLGISGNKILPDISNVNTQVRAQPSYYLIGGYKFMKSNNSFNFEPSIVLKKISNEHLSFDIHTKMYVKRINWVALSYSSLRKINFQFGIHLYKMVYAGYNYEYTLSDIASYNLGTQEIYLGINLGLFGIEGIRKSSNFD